MWAGHGQNVANESLVAEIRARGLRKTANETGLDRKTIRAILNRKKVKASTLAKVVIGCGKNRFWYLSTPRYVKGR